MNQKNAILEKTNENKAEKEICVGIA